MLHAGRHNYYGYVRSLAPKRETHMAKKKKYAKAKTYPILKKMKIGVSYISAPEVAKRLKVSLATVYGWIQRRLFKGMTKHDRGRWLIPSVGLKKPIVPEWHFSSPKSKSKRKRK